MKTKKLKKLTYQEVVLLSAQMREVAAQLARNLKEGRQAVTL
jgi:hypothetical protein